MKSDKIKMEKVSMKQISKMSDSELAESARKIARETEERSKRKAAANAILAILKKHGLSVSDLPELAIGQKRSKRSKRKSVAKRGRPAKAKIVAAQKNDKRSKVAFKYKHPSGSEKWSGRGRAPKWVNAILAKKRISITQFKADKRYKI